MYRNEVHEETLKLPQLSRKTCSHHLSMPHVGFRLSRMKKSDRDKLAFAEQYYKEGIAEGSDESLFLLMLLYAHVNEKQTLLGLWKWVRRDKEYFLDFAAYYLSMICAMGSPLPKEVIRFLSPYYGEIKMHFTETQEVSVKSAGGIYDKAMVLRYLDIVFQRGQQDMAYPDYLYMQ